MAILASSKPSSLIETIFLILLFLADADIIVPESSSASILPSVFFIRSSNLTTTSALHDVPSCCVKTALYTSLTSFICFITVLSESLLLMLKYADISVGDTHLNVVDVPDHRSEEHTSELQ